jgi:hypothetical protein
MTVVEPDAVETRLARLERRLRTLERAQRTLDVHIATLESSVVLRMLRRIGRWFPGHLHARTTPYSSWIEQESGEELPPASSLRFTILMSLSSAGAGAGARRDGLEEAVASVL